MATEVQAERLLSQHLLQAIRRTLPLRDVDLYLRSVD